MVKVVPVTVNHSFVIYSTWLHLHRCEIIIKYFTLHVLGNTCSFPGAEV